MNAINTEGAISVNPTTGREIARYEYHISQQVDDLLALANDGFQRLGGVSVSQRCDVMNRMAAILREELSHFGIREVLNPQTVWINQL